MIVEIKAEVSDLRADTFVFSAQKTIMKLAIEVAGLSLGKNLCLNYDIW